MGRNLVVTVIIASILALAFAPVHAKPAKADAKTLIIPGDSIGAFQLGVTLDEVRKIAGAPHDERTGDMTIEWTYRISGGKEKVYRFEVTALAKSRTVISLTTDIPDYRTKDGLGVGSKLNDIKKSLGEPDRITQLESGKMGIEYDKIGIGFLVSNRDSRATLVRINIPGEH
jgi:hypothetical protein